MIKPKAKGLGRGLDALLGNAEPTAPIEANGEATPHRLPIARLQPGRYQPRTRMDEGSIQELAASIRQYGLMQPIVVRPLAEGRCRSSPANGVTAQQVLRASPRSSASWAFPTWTW